MAAHAVVLPHGRGRVRLCAGGRAGAIRGAYDPQRPVVCFDALTVQLIGETRIPPPAAPGRRERYDYEYQRNGTANLFVHFEPQAGRRHVAVTDRRTKVDFAHQMRELVDGHLPDAEVVRVVIDNLNTHKPASLYEAFAPRDARRILRKLEFHYTPKHASWLNMVEIELSVLAEQCLDRRIPDKETLVQEVAAWEAARNQAKATVAWCFTVTDARTKLYRLYPS